MIDKEKIDAVKEELRRLTRAIDAWEKAPEARRSWGSVESGAVKHASMDVTCTRDAAEVGMRRTVDITVDAYDAPMLAALAKRLVHIRSLGHADDSYLEWPMPHGIGLTAHGDAADASELKKTRQFQERLYGAANFIAVFAGEVAEVLEAEIDEERVYEMLDVAAVCVRGATKKQRDIDAKGDE